MEKCTALWRETISKSKCENTTCSDHFWTFRWWKSARRCGAKHIWQSKCAKRTMLGPLLEYRKSARRCGGKQLPSRHMINTTCSDHFWTFRCRFACRRQGIVHSVKSEQNVRVLLHFQKRWQAWDIWRGSAKIHFPWQAQYFRQVEWKNRKTHWYEALNFPFLKEVSQNYFVFDVVNFENWGSIAELFRFWCSHKKCFVCDVGEFENWGSLELLSHNCFMLWMLPSSKNEEISQNCCVFKFTVRQTDRQADR